MFLKHIFHDPKTNKQIAFAHKRSTDIKADHLTKSYLVRISRFARDYRMYIKLRSIVLD